MLKDSNSKAIFIEAVWSFLFRNSMKPFVGVTIIEEVVRDRTRHGSVMPAEGSSQGRRLGRELISDGSP